MLKTVCADLHVHTCLSPCGELEMTPTRIVRTCLEREIDVIAVCDHNTAENVRGVRKAAQGTALTVLAGMEVTTAEDVHILAIFNKEEAAILLQHDVYRHLLPGENEEDIFGIQVVADEHDVVQRIIPALLIGGTTITLETLIAQIHALGGLSIASHIDREAFSLAGQLGLIPDGLLLDALEVSLAGDPEDVRKNVMGADTLPIISSSDAHRVSEIGQRCTRFRLADPTVEELALAFAEQDSRTILGLGSGRC